MIDVDHFKSVNDRFGHEMGDRVLVAVASVLKTALRPGDVVGRYGGEEFLVILPDTNVEAGKQCAERIRNAVANEIVDIDDGNPRKMVTISLGGACMKPG